jgi:hypothetical protein
MSTIYIYKNVTVRLCTNVTQNRKSPKVVHRWRCNCVFGYNFYIYIDVKTCFYSLTVKRWRCLSTEGM